MNAVVENKQVNKHENKQENELRFLTDIFTLDNCYNYSTVLPQTVAL